MAKLLSLFVLCGLWAICACRSKPGLVRPVYRPPWGKYKNAEQKFLHQIAAGRYYRGSPPSSEVGKPLKVNARMYVQAMRLDHKSDFGQPTLWAEVYLHYIWEDKSLVHYTDTDLPKDLFGKIWTPDVFVFESVAAKTLFKPAITKYVRILRNGTVIQSQKLFLTLLCDNMTSEFNPNEKVECPFSLESYGNTADILMIESFKVYHSLNQPIHLPKHNLVNIEKEKDCTFNLTTDSFLTGTCSCRRAIFHFVYKENENSAVTE